VAELRLQHRDMETAPVLAGMAGEAAFLAHLMGHLTHREPTDGSATYNKFVNYLSSSFEDMTKKVSNDNKYTFFVLSDAAVTAALGPDGGDPLRADSVFRTSTLLSQLVAERLYLRDLRDGYTAQTVGGQTLRVEVRDGETYINSARMLPREEHVYNLGNVFFLDAFPFISETELRERASQVDPELEGSGEQPEGLGHHHALGLGLENVESFAGEVGSPEGMLMVEEAGGLVEVSSPGRLAEI